MPDLKIKNSSKDHNSSGDNLRNTPEDKYDNGLYGSRKIIKRLFSIYVAPYKSNLLVAIFFMIIVAACNAAIVKLVQPAIDQVFLTHDRKMMTLLPLLMLTIYSVKGLAEYYQNFLIKYMGQQILTNIQMQMYEHLLFADLAFIQPQSSGKLISKFTNDIMLLRSAVSNMVVGAAKYFLSILFLIIVMFATEPVLSLIAFVVFPVAIYPIQKIGRKMRNIAGKTQEELSNYTSKLDETFRSIKIIKSFSAEKIEAKRAQKIAYEILSLYKKTAKFDALTAPIMEILSGIIIAFILWYGGLMVIEGNTTPGALLAFITAFVSAYRPFKSLVSLNVNLQEGLAAAERVFNVLDKAPTIQNVTNAKEVNFQFPEIIFSNVSLQFYDEYNNAKTAIRNIKKLEFLPGKTYAIVGRSGSGKTSLANLLVRFYDPTSGTIEIDGCNIKDISLESLRQNIALITQDTILFDATISENISYGYNDATAQQIERAAKSADADSFIRSLPNGYNTKIGDQGFSLSGGQRQKLAIARAFLKDAHILILDEATSSLDSSSEQAVLEALSALRSSRTTLFITHRLASITQVYCIIVMKNGEIIEQGTHQELIAKEGEYYRLYNRELQELE